MSQVPLVVSLQANDAHVSGSVGIRSALQAHLPIAIRMIANSEAVLEAAEPSNDRRPARRAANGASGIKLEVRT